MLGVELEEAAAWLKAAEAAPIKNSATRTNATFLMCYSTKDSSVAVAWSMQRLIVI